MSRSTFPGAVYAYLERILLQKSSSYKVQMAGVLSISIGCLLLTTYPTMAVKISATLILIGLIIVVLVKEKTPVPNADTTRTTAGLCTWTIVVLLITQTVDIEVFFVLTFLGFLLIKEATESRMSPAFRWKMNAFIVSFLLIFILIVVLRMLYL